MPREKGRRDLSEGVGNVLPEHAKENHRKAHNNTLEEYKDPAKRGEPGCYGQSSLFS
jgi:cation transport regulator ChaB